jgi:hypothetical protein
MKQENVIKTKAFVLLASVGNPDKGQDPNAPYMFCEDDCVEEITTLEQASKLCADFIERNGLGCGNWAGGKVVDSVGNVIAHISYNGRAWKDLDLKEEFILNKK